MEGSQERLRRLESLLRLFGFLLALAALAFSLSLLIPYFALKLVGAVSCSIFYLVVLFVAEEHRFLVFWISFCEESERLDAEKQSE